MCQSKQVLDWVVGGGGGATFQSIYLLSRHFDIGGKQINLPIDFFVQT